ncbi:MAG: 2-oxo acid dehydrogenase subunit E2 [Streptococcus salivarius]
MRDFPALNAWYGGGIHKIHERIHIGMATALDDGLLVIQDADCMILQIWSKIKTLANCSGTLVSDSIVVLLSQYEPRGAGVE